MNEIKEYEDSVLAYGRQELLEIDGLTIYGSPNHHTSILAFNVAGIHHYDLGTLLDTQGIAVRTGQHCTQPIMNALGVEGTVRASLALYNTREEIDALVAGIHKVKKMLGK